MLYFYRYKSKKKLTSNEKKYYLFVPILIAMFFINSFFTTSQNLDETYTILRKVDKVEIREYKPCFMLHILISKKKVALF